MEINKLPELSLFWTRSSFLPWKGEEKEYKEKTEERESFKKEKRPGDARGGRSGYPPNFLLDHY